MADAHAKQRAENPKKVQCRNRRSAYIANLELSNLENVNESSLRTAYERIYWYTD